MTVNPCDTLAAVKMHLQYPSLVLISYYWYFLFKFTLTMNVEKSKTASHDKFLGTRQEVKSSPGFSITCTDRAFLC